MWTRKHLKHQAKKSLKSNYQKMVSVCFLIAFLTNTSEFSRCLQFLDRNRHAAARISDFVFRCTTGNSVRTHPQYIYQWKIFYLCHFKDCQRGLP